jgi:hypothetical protein
MPMGRSILPLDESEFEPMNMPSGAPPIGAPPAPPPGGPPMPPPQAPPPATGGPLKIQQLVPGLNVRLQSDGSSVYEVASAVAGEPNIVVSTNKPPPIPPALQFLNPLKQIKQQTEAAAPAAQPQRQPLPL